MHYDWCPWRHLVTSTLQLSDLVNLSWAALSTDEEDFGKSVILKRSRHVSAQETHLPRIKLTATYKTGEFEIVSNYYSFMQRCLSLCQMYYGDGWYYDLPKAITSFRLIWWMPLSIWTMTYLPDISLWPKIFISNDNLKVWPEMVMCCPWVPGPAKWPRRAPPENIWLAEAGSSSEMRTSTFRVRFPQQLPIRLKISTLLTVTVFP